ncbi:MAG: hypothetical protein OXT74_10745, partial [Candidatus Poribacteria bacterium]|nr:hypothetical protein [Candidatus Poribacteria bacterium]
QGFNVNEKSGTNCATNELVLEENSGVITVKHGNQVLMTRYTGNKALGYLRQKQLLAKQQFTELKAKKFRDDITSYETEINPKGSDTSTASEDVENTNDGNSDA